MFNVHPSFPFLLEPCNDLQLAREEPDSRATNMAISGINISDTIPKKRGFYRKLLDLLVF